MFDVFDVPPSGEAKAGTTNITFIIVLFAFLCSVSLRLRQKAFLVSRKVAHQSNLKARFEGLTGRENHKGLRRPSGPGARRDFASHSR